MNNAVVAGGPHDWHMVNGQLTPGLAPDTAAKVMLKRRARAGLPAIDAPDVSVLREKAQLLTLAEQRLENERIALRREQQEWENEKAAREAERAKARGKKKGDE